MTDGLILRTNENGKVNNLSLLNGGEPVREDISSYYAPYEDNTECSELCVDAAASVLYAITSKFIMQRETTLTEKLIDFDYHQLLSLSANDNKEGIPIIINLDADTSLEMLKSSVKLITKPLIDSIRKEKRINIDIEFQEISYNEILIGVLWERGDSYWEEGK